MSSARLSADGRANAPKKTPEYIKSRKARILKGMKKQIRLKSAALCSVVVLSPLLFNAASLGGLKDIAEPYLGTYECEQIFVGDEEKTDKFDYVRLELKPKGEMKLFFKEKGGLKSEAEARYTYDTEKNVLTIYANVAGAEKKKQFPVKKGTIDVSVRYGGKMLMMKFVQK